MVTRLVRNLNAGLCLSLVTAVLAGCAHSRELRLEVNPNVRIPDRPVLILFADGVRADLVDDMMAGGELGHLKRYLYDRGCRARQAVSCLPSITYAVTASIVTGRFPGHHHILGNKWFDRHSGKFQDYTFIRTYQQIDHDVRAPTIFEMLPDKYTVTIQTPNRLGATRAIDNWATSGINWFFNRLTTVDQLVAVRFELIARAARTTGQWPDLILAYFPAVDEIGHRAGSDSTPYRQALVNLDEQIGRICRGLENAGLLDRYTIFFVSDHGHVPVAKDNHWSPAKFLRQRGVHVVSDMFLANANTTDRHQSLNRTCRAVIVNGGNRRAHVHLRTGPFWYDEPTYDQVLTFVKKFVPNWQKRVRSDNLMHVFAWQPAVRLVAAKRDRHRVMIFFRDQTALIERKPQTNTYRYQPLRGDPLGYRDAEPTRTLIDGTFHDGQTWLAASAPGDFPDFVPQIVPMFDSPRAGQIVLFAANGWDFSPADRSGHGSALRQDMIVPFVVAGPGIRQGEIPTARVVDIVPTVVDLLGLNDRLRQAGQLDGRSLWPNITDMTRPQTTTGKTP